MMRDKAGARSSIRWYAPTRRTGEKLLFINEGPFHHPTPGPTTSSRTATKWNQDCPSRMHDLFAFLLRQVAHVPEFPDPAFAGRRTTVVFWGQPAPVQHLRRLPDYYPKVRSMQRAHDHRRPVRAEETAPAAPPVVARPLV